MTRPSRVVAVVHAVTLVVAAAALMWVNRGQWFVGDEWDLIVDRQLGSLDDLLRPHNEHWSTLPILVWRPLVALIGLHEYWPYLLPLLAAHVLAAHLVWRLQLRADVDPWVATGLVVVFLVVGEGWENLLWAFQFGFVGSLALGLLQVLLVDHDGPLDRRDVGAAVVGILALLTSGIAVVLVAVAGLTALLRRRLAAALVTTLPAGLTYLAWTLTYGRPGLATHEPLRTTSPGDILRYVWSGLTGVVELGSGLGAWGAVVLAAIAALAGVHVARTDGPHGAALATAVGVPLLLAVIAVGRTGAGIELARSSRYVHLGTALLLPATGMALTTVADAAWWRRLPLLALLALVAWHGWTTLTSVARATAAVEQERRDRVLAAAELVTSDAPLVSSNVDAATTPNLQTDELARLAARGALPASASIDALDRLHAAAELQVALSEEPALPPAPGPGALLVGTSVEPLPPVVGGCLGVTAPPDAQVALHFPDPGVVTVTSEPGGELLAYLGDPDGLVVEDPRRWPLPPAEARHLAVSRPDATLVLSLPDGQVDLCGVAASSSSTVAG